MREPETHRTSRAWSWRHAVGASDLPFTTRGLLWALSLKMDDTGGSCFPSIADLVALTGLDKKTVLKHLDVAAEAGWIEIGQHGYRGQRWKRNEYVAKWPGRDLTGEAADGAQPDEGGGAVPPPSDAGKVVEPGDEGGGIEGMKVVEPLHQDKTLPEQPSRDLSTERESAREPEDQKRIDARGWALLKDWPQFAGMPKEAAMKAWRSLTPVERDEAERKFHGWLALLKAQNKSNIPAPSSYFVQKLFREVNEPGNAEPAFLEAKPFGKLWQAWRLKQLLAGILSGTAIPDLSYSQRSAVERGAANADQIRRDNRMRHGWPGVNRLHEAASVGKSAHVSAELVPLAELMETVHVSDPLFEAWRLEHERRGWPWLPDPGKHEWFSFPAGGPEAGLKAFEAAMRGCEKC